MAKSVWRAQVGVKLLSNRRDLHLTFVWRSLIGGRPAATEFSGWGRWRNYRANATPGAAAAILPTAAAILPTATGLPTATECRCGGGTSAGRTKTAEGGTGGKGKEGPGGAGSRPGL